MSELDIEASLKAAQTAIDNSQYKEALKFCQSVLKADKTSTAALGLIGKTALYLKEYDQSELAYRRALRVDPQFSPAWEGLAELFIATDNVAGQIEANEHLLEQTSEEDPRDRAVRLRLAEAYSRSGALDQAIQQYFQVLSVDQHPWETSPFERVDLLCSLADVMLRRDEAAVCKEVQEKAQADGTVAMDTATAPATFHPPTAREISHGEAQSTSGLVNRTMSCLEVDILAARAVQDSESGELSIFLILHEISEHAPPALKYLPYREEYIRRCLLRIFHAPPRSTERQQYRLAALRECVNVLCHGGSSSPLPYEAAVWLLEEEEEIKGGQVSVGGQEIGGTQTLAGGIQAGAEGHIGAGRQATVALATENFSRRLVHQFPFHPTARVLLALMLRRHAVHARQPISQVRRRQLERLLTMAMEDGSTIDCASGFKALSELQYENRHYEQAISTSMRGLKWLQNRRERGHEALTQIALSLRLVLAKSLRRVDRLDEAEKYFKSLAGWVTEGEAAFSEMAGSAPTSIHQQALRGIALVALARGDVQGARAQYERILGKAALGRGPAEHWAHADYGWLLYQNGNYQDARFHLEQAIHVAQEEGCAATDSQVAEHKYRLGEVYWKLKGRYKTERQFAYTHFMESAKVEGHAQAPALAALGRFFDQVEKRPDAAEKCFKKALAIDPTVDIAGDGLCAHLVEAGRKDAARGLCSQVVVKAPQAVWAWRRLGILLIEENEPAEAVSALLTALRSDPADVVAWEALGAAYQPLGRLTAALKAYTRALELDPKRIYSLIQSGNLQLILGKPDEALQCFQNALQYDEGHAGALLGAAEALTILAEANINVGAIKAAAKDLQRAIKYASTCTRDVTSGNLISGWKCLGDALLLSWRAPPSLFLIDSEPIKTDIMGSATLTSWNERIHVVQKARKAYIKAVHFDPSSSSGWNDVACAFHHESQLIDMTHGSHSEISTILHGKSEQCLRAALRIEPSSCELWAALGMAAKDAERKEYALSRSLQLNPKFVPAWVALARLYIDAGQGALAERCLQQGRSQDPTIGLIWEGMAALSALSSSPAAEKEWRDFNEHAVGLGASAEGLLGFVQASLKADDTGYSHPNNSNKATSGKMYAYARRAMVLDPLNPATLNVWGLACESRNDYNAACQAYAACLELLPSSIATGKIDPFHIHPPILSNRIPVVMAVKMNLARSLAQSGRWKEAMEIYRDLESEEGASGIYAQPEALISYATVLTESGEFEGAEKVCIQAIQCIGDNGALAASVVKIILQIQILAARPHATLNILGKYLPQLVNLKASAEAIMELWRFVLATADDESAGKKVLEAAKVWAAQADQQNATFFADLLSLLAIKSRRLSTAQKAVHSCPTSYDARLVLSSIAHETSPFYSPSILKLIENNNNGLNEYMEGYRSDVLYSRLEAAAVSLIDCGIATDSSVAEKEWKLAIRAVHTNPKNGKNWYLASLIATQRAALENGSANSAKKLYKKALDLSQCALSMTSEDKEKANLLICISESLLRVGRVNEALEKALEAVEISDNNNSGTAERQVARCWWILDDNSKAESRFRKAINDDNMNSTVVSCIELAQCLQSFGRHSDALDVLTGCCTTRNLSPRVSTAYRKTLFQQVLLQKCLTLARIGDFSEAIKLCTEDIQRDPKAWNAVSLLVYGASLLQQALVLGPDTQEGSSLLGKARRILSESLAKGGGWLPTALLAKLESVGSYRKKAERVAMYTIEALKLSKKPIPGDLLFFLGQLQDTKSTLVRRAVHQEPWQARFWSASSSRTLH